LNDAFEAVNFQKLANCIREGLPALQHGQQTLNGAMLHSRFPNRDVVKEFWNAVFQLARSAAGRWRQAERDSMEEAKVFLDHQMLALRFTLFDHD
jgi:hypothetical protein